MRLLSTQERHFKKNTQRESLSYDHGNTTVQMIFEEATRERGFPPGQLTLEVAVMEQNKDKHDEQAAALSYIKIKTIQRY